MSASDLAISAFQRFSISAFDLRLSAFRVAAFPSVSFSGF
jgi:hypothetical protein